MYNVENHGSTTRSPAVRKPLYTHVLSTLYYLFVHSSYPSDLFPPVGERRPVLFNFIHTRFRVPIKARFTNNNVNVTDIKTSSIIYIVYDEKLSSVLHSV